MGYKGRSKSAFILVVCPYFAFLCLCILLCKAHQLPTLNNYWWHVPDYIPAHLRVLILWILDNLTSAGAIKILKKKHPVHCKVVAIWKDIQLKKSCWSRKLVFGAILLLVSSCQTDKRHYMMVMMIKMMISIFFFTFILSVFILINSICLYTFIEYVSVLIFLASVLFIFKTSIFIYTHLLHHILMYNI